MAMIRCPSCSFQNPAGTYFCGKCRLYLHPVGEYKLLRVVGKGGFASVYEAIHQRSQKKAAIKIMHREHLGHADVEQRFLREAKVLLELNSPQVVKLYDFGVCHTEELGIYLVMEWCHGQTLQQAIQERPLRRFAPGEALSLFSQLLMGLHHIHQKRIVHRDLKPTNLMLLEDKGDILLKILDFGLAWVDEETLTKTGTVIGSLRYMAPEQIRGEKGKYGPTTDLYSAGLILAWMLTGKHVFSGSTVEMIAMQHTLEQPPSLQELCPGMHWPQALEHILSKALQKEPQNRFRSAQEFLHTMEDPALSTMSGSHISLSSVSPYEETAAMKHLYKSSSHRRYSWILPLLLLLLTGLFIYMIAIAPQFSNVSRTIPPDASPSSNPHTHPDASPSKEPDFPETLGHVPQKTPDVSSAEKSHIAVPVWIQTLLAQWQQSWLQLKEKPLQPKTLAAYQQWYHTDFFDKQGQMSRTDYLQQQTQLAQQSAWFTVNLKEIAITQQSTQDFTVQFKQILAYSTLKAKDEPDADITGSTYRKIHIMQLYWRNTERGWKILQVNGYGIQDP